LCRTKVAGWAAASTAPNKKRLAQRSRRRHRPHRYKAAKNPHAHMGGFFAALKTGSGGGMEEGALKRHCARWRKKGKPAMAGYLQKLLVCALT